MFKQLRAVSLVMLAACGATSKTDGGVDAGAEAPAEVKVSGTVRVFPDAVGVLADAGVSFTTNHLTVRVEEPFKVAINNPDGIFYSSTLDATGTFAAPTVTTELVTLGIAVGVRDDSSGGAHPLVVRSATTVYDVALNDGAKPVADVTGAKAWAVPYEFHQALTALVTEARIRTITGANDAGTLINAGFVLGKVVDAQGNPVSGATIEPIGATGPARTARLFYPSADLKTLGTSSSANGLFLYVHTGGDVDTFQFKVTGRTEYKQRSAGAAKDACLVLTVFPGVVEP